MNKELLRLADSEGVNLGDLVLRCVWDEKGMSYPEFDTKWFFKDDWSDEDRAEYYDKYYDRIVYFHGLATQFEAPDILEMCEDRMKDVEFIVRHAPEYWEAKVSWRVQWDEGGQWLDMDEVMIYEEEPPSDFEENYIVNYWKRLDEANGLGYEGKFDPVSEMLSCVITKHTNP